VTAFLLILSALGATPNDRPAATSGDVVTCDFEEATDRDYDGWPDGWTRRRSRELPEFLQVAIVEESPAGSSLTGKPGGNHCLAIQLDGGGAVIDSPAFPVSPQFSLLLTLRMKTAGLKHDGAWVELTLLDADGQTLQSRASPPLTHCPDWQEVRIGPIIELHGDVAKARVTLHLERLGKREDLRGHAWFDDLKLIRLPRMQLIASTQPGLYPGLYTKADAAELVCRVSGIRVRNPRVRFELFNQNREKPLVETVEPLTARHDSGRVLGGDASVEGYAGQATWSPPLGECGFYRVRATLFGDEPEPSALDRTQTLALLRNVPAPLRSEFGWSLTGNQTPADLGPLAALLGQAGLGWAKLPVWYDTHETTQADRIAWFAEQLSLQGIELVGVFDQPPPELRRSFRDSERLPIASVFAEPEVWQPAVGPIMTRLSLKVHWWQLGDDNDISFVGYPQMEPKLAEIKRHLEQYGQQIYLGMNWRWIDAPPKPSAGRTAPWSFLSYGIDPPLTAEESRAYLQPSSASGTGAGGAPPAAKATATVPPSITAPAPVNGLPSLARRKETSLRRWMLLAPLTREEYSTDVRVQDLVLRMLAAKMYGADAAFVPQPFDDDVGIMNADGSPGELFVPWRMTAMLIGGADYLGPLQLAGGSIGQVFARQGRAVMAVWTDRPTTERVYLGDDIEQIDVWGRSTRPTLREQDGRPIHELPIGIMPTFITGLSESVVRWQAALTFENSQLSSVAGRDQVVFLRLKNTFSQAVNGELTLHAPKTWGIDPRPQRFKIAEGEVQRVPLPVTLMGDANSGPQPVRLDFEVAGYRFSVHRTLQLGLDDVQVEMMSRLRNDGTPQAPRWNMVVDLHLTNMSDQPLSFQCVLFAPGRRRETRQVINVGRDRQTLSFVLPDGEQLVGKKLWLRAEEIGGPRVLNYPLVAER
jgi:hypothetical protein